MKRILVLMIILAVTAASISACASSDTSNITAPEPDENRPVVIEPEPELEPEPEVPEFVNSLTGLESEKDLSSVRPFAVVMNNIRKATPQRGISYADVIFEAPAEGGITRILSVFTDIHTPGQLGSIRSMRPYFIDFVKCLNPIFIHGGGSDDAYAKIKNEGIVNIDGVNGNDYIFFRDSARRQNAGYEHSLMADTSLIDEYLEKKSISSASSSAPNLGFTFGESSALSGTDAETVTAKFSSSKTTSFTYSDDGMYYASQYGNKMTDELTGEQLAVKNILIIKTSVKVLDSVGRVAIATTGSGSGYYVCEGKYIPVTWSRSSTSTPISFADSEGNAIVMAPGVTYICVVETDFTME